MAATVGGSVRVVGCLMFALAQMVTAGDFVILSCPKSVLFVSDAKAIKTDEISPLIAASFGLSLNKDLQWDGLREVSLFERPKASAVISITGVPDGRLDDIPNVARYKTLETENGLSTADLSENIESVDWKKDPLIVDFTADGNMFDIISRHPDLFTSLPSTLGALADDVSTGVAPRWFGPEVLASLNMSQDADLRFIGELYVIQEIVHALLENAATVKTNSPDFFHFRIGGLETLAQTYGADSVQFGDALRLLRIVVMRVSNELQQLYSSDVVVQLVTFSPQAAALKSSISRHGRSLLADTAANLGASVSNELNLAPYFSEMYASIFNICLWTMIAFGLAIFFVSWGIWNMDPGRDSIIYRMTSQRMKRD